jgi:hypothetical protein
LEAGSNATISWMLTANSSITNTVIVEVEGMISGSVWAHVNYSAYDYYDRIGVAINITIELKEDSNSPLIGTPSRVPEGDVSPDQEAKVLVNVTDVESGVENVTLFYNLNDSVLWTPLSMDFNSTSSFYEATIPKQPAGTWVKYEIIAYDKVGNFEEQNNNNDYFIYKVVPEFTSITIILFLVILSMIAAALSRILSKTKLTD